MPRDLQSLKEDSLSGNGSVEQVNSPQAMSKDDEDSMVNQISQTHGKSKRDELHPYTQSLTVNDIESCAVLEEATFPPQERCTREKVSQSDRHVYLHPYRPLRGEMHMSMQGAATLASRVVYVRPYTSACVVLSPSGALINCLKWHHACSDWTRDDLADFTSMITRLAQMIRRLADLQIFLGLCSRISLCNLRTALLVAHQLAMFHLPSPHENYSRAYDRTRSAKYANIITNSSTTV